MQSLSAGISGAKRPNVSRWKATVARVQPITCRLKTKDSTASEVGEATLSPVITCSKPLGPPPGARDYGAPFPGTL